jgi:hypothetical protein
MNRRSGFGGGGEGYGIDAWLDRARLVGGILPAAAAPGPRATEPRRKRIAVSNFMQTYVGR